MRPARRHYSSRSFSLTRNSSHVLFPSTNIQTCSPDEGAAGEVALQQLASTRAAPRNSAAKLWHVEVTFSYALFARLQLV